MPAINRYARYALQVVCLISMPGYAQTNIGCDHLLKKKMTGEPHVVLANVKLLAGCGLDSIDIQILGNGPGIAGYLIKNINEKKEPTYGDFVNYILSLRKESFYDSARELTKSLNIIQDKIASLNTWDADTKVFLSIGFTIDELNARKEYLRNNNERRLTYKTLFAEFAYAQKYNLKNAVHEDAKKTSVKPK
jgi:hypothetical protein